MSSVDQRIDKRDAGVATAAAAAATSWVLRSTTLFLHRVSVVACHSDAAADRVRGGTDDGDDERVNRDGACETVRRRKRIERSVYDR